MGGRPRSDYFVIDDGAKAGTPPGLVVVGNTGQVTVRGRNPPEATMLGGAGFNVAVGALASGASPKLITVVGDDLPLQSLRMVQRLATPTSLARARGRTASFEIAYIQNKPEPLIRSHYGVARQLTRHAISQNYGRAYVHVVCRDPLDSAVVVAHVRSTDPGCLSLAFGYASMQGHLESLGRCLAFADFLFFNEREWALAAPYLRKARYRGYSVETYGGRGAAVRRDGRLLARASSAPVQDMIDPTGAGDVFAGAFLACHQRGGTLRDALDVATVVAAESCSGWGVNALLRGIGGPHARRRNS